MPGVQVLPADACHDHAHFFTKFLAALRCTVQVLQAQHRPTIHLVLPRLGMLLSPQSTRREDVTDYQKRLLSVLAGQAASMPSAQRSFIKAYWTKLMATW